MTPIRTARWSHACSTQKHPCLVALVLAAVSLVGASGGAVAADAVLAWNTVSAASGYRISYGTTSGRYTRTLNVGRQTTATVRGLRNGTTYYFALQSRAGSRTSAYSQEVSGTIGTRGRLASDDTGGGLGLVAAYGFDEASGSNALDASGNGNHGVLANVTRSATGRFGGALSFSSRDSMVTVPSSATLDLTTGMTLAAWVNPAARQQRFQSIVTKERPGGLAYALHASSPAGRVSSTLSLGSANRTLQGGSPLPAGIWSHLTATYDGSNQRLYVNGVQVASRASTGTLPTSASPLRIGNDGVLSGRAFSGMIDEVRVYDRALSQGDVVSLSREAVNP